MTRMANDHEQGGDLGFRYRARKNGEVEILRDGRQVSLLRGKDAADFLARAGEAGADEPDVQQLLARLTGNYKRGNERLAGNHRRDG
jgi:hypothetical protein